MSIAFLGLGRMGRILANHLVDDGEDVIVWNRSAGPAADLVAAGAQEASGPREAVEDAHVVITTLFGPDAVRDVVLRGALPFARDALWLDITTVGPADADEFADWAREDAVRYVAGPVIGSLVPAAQRRLGVALGGAPDAVEEARDIAAHWANPERIAEYDSARKAAVAKLIANLGIAVATQGIAEALRLGHGGGMDTQEVFAALKGTALERQYSLKAAMLEARDYDATQFSTDLLAKDLRLMIATAHGALPAATTMLDALEAMQSRGQGNIDFAAVLDRDVLGR